MTERALTAAMRQFFIAENKRDGRIAGSSMEPALHDGQNVTVAGCCGRFVPGRCYVFFHKGRLVLHRLVFHTGKAAYFAGDNLCSVEKVPLGNIVCELRRDELLPARVPIALGNLLFLFLRKLPVAKRLIRTLRARWIYFISRRRAVA
jgi:hypothetical protein